MLNQIDPSSGGTSPGETLEAIEQWHIALAAIINHIWENWDDPKELRNVKLYPEYYLSAFGFNPEIPSYKTKIKFVFDNDDQVTYKHNNKIKSFNGGHEEKKDKEESNKNEHRVEAFKLIEKLDEDGVSYSSSRATKIVTVKDITDSLEASSLTYYGRRLSNDNFVTFWMDVNRAQLWKDEASLGKMDSQELSSVLKILDVDNLKDLITLGKLWALTDGLSNENDKLKTIGLLAKYEDDKLSKKEREVLKDLLLSAIKGVATKLPKVVEKKLKVLIEEAIDKRKAGKNNKKGLSDIVQLSEKSLKNQNLVILDQFYRSLRERGEAIRLRLRKDLEAEHCKKEETPVEVQVVLHKIHTPLPHENEQVLFSLKGCFKPKGEVKIEQIQENVEVNLNPHFGDEPHANNAQFLEFDGTISNFLSGEKYGDLHLECLFQDYIQLFNLRDRTNGWKYEDLSSLAGVMVVVIPPKPAEDEDMPAALEDYMSICRNQPFTCS